MGSHQSIDVGLLHAYQQTDYEVHAEPKFTVKINEKSNDLARLFDEQAVESAAFITAFNPYSKLLSEQENLERNQTLLNVASVFHAISGRGVSADGQYEEASYLFLGMGLDEAKVLGKQFEQNAILWIGQDAIPKLIILV